ncbi:MAG: hypothetical protein ACE3JK_06340 [Sporolactobacillus sp.]
MEFINIQDAAKLIGVEVNDILQLIVSGHIHLCIERGKHSMLSRAEVERFKGSLRD